MEDKKIINELNPETIKELMLEAHEFIDADYAWNDIFQHSNLHDSFIKGNVSLKEIVRIAFLCGVNFGLYQIAGSDDK